MSSDTRIFIVNNIKLPLNASVGEAFSVARKRLSKLNVGTNELKFRIYRRSVDARHKTDIKFVYSVAVSGRLPKLNSERLKSADITEMESVSLSRIASGAEDMKAPPLIVGAGPAGLFAALLLAEHGYAPIVIERGGSVAERKEAVRKFNEQQNLDLNTNIQFGAGGAGTFSDGKLVTRINDPISSYVLEKFVSFGAPDEILYLARPHIGTDVLAPVIERMTERIEELGGKVLYHTKYLYSLDGLGEHIAVTENGRINYGALILAIGHSARDTYSELITRGFDIEAKPFSVGMRIEHLTENIDRALYGDFAGHKSLGHAEYNLAYNTKERGVYTFCMCPGGEVVAAASEDGGVVVNGMSRHSRSGINSNSAVVCSVFKEDYGNTPEKAIEFQRNIERAAFRAAGKNYAAPTVTVGDFLNGRAVSEPTSVKPTYMGGSHIKIADPAEYLPKFVCDSIRGALVDFDKKISGFASNTAILTGAETRTSAPVRIVRHADTRIAKSTDNIYPCGEGAGYAGGIMSAAVDGIKTAISVIQRYRPSKNGG